jgi:hypothetical protein
MFRIGLGVLVLSLLLTVGLGIEKFTGLIGLFPALETDQVTDQQAKDRQHVFLVLGPIQLKRVRAVEMGEALRSMNLAPVEESRLTQHLLSSNVPKKPGAESAPISVPQQLVQEDAKGIPLAWITLWDTDAVDTDIVRLDSEGYTSMVTLSKSPTTFAVPIPQSGIINITGIRDGGGGITVGVESGGRPISLPLMSEDQVIGIPVSIQ